ncbi:MAG: cation transporter [Candidatus Marinimicrobia bacterium]|jgi:copper chaperone|nr:cation transporter [Candidatus Neomarinimicrobiota bacterium]MBT3632818.1 cation transporter [Candidatus Neomarinimicrobiota bacterium]MBT3681928.1 cation transporter [Candidatus Neomarinimicrobiota bacterium]MBT3759043.1 cation transporter [Candidatus Neomarinimicrobiota bacterium]MBT3895058.1 cation transporter [Candidatus Neomarinimicrobiota bacterium]
MKEVVFKVNDMTCGGCAGKIQKAIEESDVSLKVNIDIDKKKVSVTGNITETDAKEIIINTGYTPEKFKKGWFGR